MFNFEHTYLDILTKFFILGIGNDGSSSGFNMYVTVVLYIYIYIYTERERERTGLKWFNFEQVIM